MNKKNLVMIHGAGCNSSLWKKERINSGCLVHIINLPGHDHSKSLEEISIKNYANWVVEYLRKNHISSVILCGHSMGGAISQTIALDYPQYVKGLVLVGTGAKLGVSPAFMKLLKQPKLSWLSLFISIKKSFPKKASKDAISIAKEMLSRSGQDILYKDLSACIRFNAMNRTSEIKVPTLVICGRQDELAPPKYSQYLADHINNSELKWLDDTGHFPSLERPKEFYQFVNDWLKSFY